MTATSGTRMVPVEVRNPATLESHTLEEVLIIAGRNGTEPFCSSFGPITGPGSFAALITAYNASGNLDAAWMSEPMFGSAEAAEEHAEDLIGPDLFSIINSFDATWDLS